MNTATIATLDPVTEALKAKLGDDLIAVVLFGSRARGEGKRSSDWDLFLIAEGLPENPFDRQLALRTLLPRKSARVSILAKTQREFETTFPPLYLDLAVDGVVLYDPQAYMQERLNKIRRIIEEASLTRARRRNALVWEWREVPQDRWRIDWSGTCGLERRGEV
jgi:predicted nucleotidyltransferase